MFRRVVANALRQAAATSLAERVATCGEWAAVATCDNGHRAVRAIYCREASICLACARRDGVRRAGQVADRIRKLEDDVSAFVVEVSAPDRAGIEAAGKALSSLVRGRPMRQRSIVARTANGCVARFLVVVHAADAVLVSGTLASAGFSYSPLGSDLDAAMLDFFSLRAEVLGASNPTDVATWTIRERVAARLDALAPRLVAFAKFRALGLRPIGGLAIDWAAVRPHRPRVEPRCSCGAKCRAEVSTWAEALAPNIQIQRVA